MRVWKIQLVTGTPVVGGGTVDTYVRLQAETRHGAVRRLEYIMRRKGHTLSNNAAWYWENRQTPLVAQWDDDQSWDNVAQIQFLQEAGT